MVVDSYVWRMCVQSQLVDAAHLVLTTLNSAASACLQGATFSVVVVDEAAQGTDHNAHMLQEQETARYVWSSC